MRNKQGAGEIVGAVQGRADNRLQKMQGDGTFNKVLRLFKPQPRDSAHLLHHLHRTNHTRQ